MSRSKSIDRATIRLFWQAGLNHKPQLLLGMMHPLGAILMSTIVPLFIGRILASLAMPGGRPMHYLWYLLVAAVAGAIANRWGFRAVLRYQARTMSDLQAQALEVLLKR